jgi:2-polyprenyl-3-methyl-5-hydroxy-6-metoxy-1,4-benzoquinol methylase
MKISFQHRHPGPEMMDRNDIPPPDLFQNYRELHLVNLRLGGYRITLRGLAALTSNSKTCSVLDIGCGGGDTLKKMAEWGREQKYNFSLTGIDTSESAIQYATANCKEYNEISFLRGDVFNHLVSGKKYDVIHSCLFMHHFGDEKIVSLLKLMDAASEKGFMINDLERNPLAYYSIKLLTLLLSKSYLVKNDAPLSVLRGFKKKEWYHYLGKAGIPTGYVSWQWAFRHLVLIEK